MKRDSFVVYGKARIEDAQKLLRGIKDGKLVPHVPVTAEVFARICDGLLRSLWTAPRLQQFYRAAVERGAQSGR